MENSAARPRTVAAAINYAAWILALGFVLGVGRALLQTWAPNVDRLTAVIIELPIILTASWLVAEWCITRFNVPAHWPARALMGGVALALLLMAETALGLANGHGLAEHLALYAGAAYQAGLAGQIVFGLIPLLRLRVQSSAG